MEHHQGGRKAAALSLPLLRCVPGASGRRPLLLFGMALAWLGAALWLDGCVPARQAVRTVPRADNAHSLPRADPGYLQWLEKQSMLGSAQEITGQVSGTERVWDSSATPQRADMLRAAAPNWLLVDPHAVSTPRTVLHALDQEEFVRFMAQQGLSGVFLSPVGERGDIWQAPSTPSASISAGEDGSNTTSLRLDPAVGDDTSFLALTDRLEEAHIQTGGDLLPAATGLGPDFMLQARRAARFDGLYAMLPAAREDWDILPQTAEAWDCRPLTAEMLAEFRRRGREPQALERDSLNWPRPGGWAATGPVLGADGQTRRWLYRYSGHALRPVLLWQDPSGQARRVFSAAIIRHTGLQRQTLAGLRLEGFWGLDAKKHRPSPARDALTPGVEALDALAREVRRYGGWSLQNEILPPSLTTTVLDTSVDFSRDSSVPAAAAFALLSGDASPLTTLLQRSLAAGVDHSRLARGLDGGVRLDWRPLLDLADGAERVRQARSMPGFSSPEPEIFASTAFLAARALGLAETTAARPEHSPAMHTACLLLLGWRLGLPGLAFVSPHDLTGALAGPQSALPGAPPRVPLWAEDTSGQAAATVPQVFGSLAHQAARPDSFAKDVAHLLRQRHKSGLASGSLRSVQAGPPGCVTALSALPGGGHWLLAANFSGTKKRLRCPLPSRTAQARDVFGGVLPLKENILELELDARHARHILLTPHPTSKGANP